MNISFDEFEKLDIRIGTIKSAEKAEGADKLLVIIVDLGDEERQIISGISEFYSPDDLVNRQVPVLVNLEPKTFRGYKSQGMILMADENGKPILLHPSIELAPGTVVR